MKKIEMVIALPKWMRIFTIKVLNLEGVAQYFVSIAKLGIKSNLAY